jgi:hypothetical protein
VIVVRLKPTRFPDPNMCDAHETSFFVILHW